MKPFVARGRRVAAAVGSVVLGAGLAVAFTPSAGSALPAPAPDDRTTPVSEPAGPGAKALSEALPARLGSLRYVSVYGSTKARSSSGKKLTVSLSATQERGAPPSFYIALSRASTEQHAWRFPAPSSSFNISGKASGKLSLSPKASGGMAKVAVKVKPDGAVKSEKCGGKVYAKTRNVTISGTVYLNTGSAWGKVGSKTKPFKFRTTHRAYLSYKVTCPPVEYPDPCYDLLSWSVSRSTAKTYTSVSARKDGSRSSVYAYRSTKLAKPEGATRSDSVWGTGRAPALTVDADGSAKMKIHGIKGSGTIADSNSGAGSERTCDTGTQHTTYWWSGRVTNDAPPIKVPAQVFGSFTVPNGSSATLTKASFD